MRVRLRELLLVTLIFGQLPAEDFISKMEYAKMLYANPRGIGCNKCHGEKGEGSIISTYMHKGKKMILEAPNITTISKERFIQALNMPHKVMPTYFLTEREIESLYYYVSSSAKK